MELHREKTAMTMSRRFFTLAATPLAAIGTAAMLATPASPAAAQETACVGREQHGTSITVIAEGVRNNRGKLVVTIYPDSRRDFLAGGGELNVGKVDAREGETRARVCIPEPGVYAIAVYHDEDGDGQFDRSLTPDEGYGFSNNPSTIAGLPSFRSVRLNVSRNGLATRVQMKYP